MPYELPSLPYAHDALEPYIDAQTMQIHHGKHHATYVTKLNEALAKHPELEKRPLTSLLRALAGDEIPADIRTAVRNHGGGHYNHSLFWTIMKAKGGGEPSGELAKAVESTFGSFAGFREKFSKAALDVFGSGWAWLCLRGNDLVVTSTPNQDSPLMLGDRPILGLDVWEHAYYLKYQNRRPDYVEGWWSVVNWDQVAENYSQVKKSKDAVVEAAASPK